MRKWHFLRVNGAYENRLFRRRPCANELRCKSKPLALGADLAHAIKLCIQFAHCVGILSGVALGGHDAHNKDVVVGRRARQRLKEPNVARAALVERRATNQTKTSRRREMKQRSKKTLHRQTLPAATTTVFVAIRCRFKKVHQLDDQKLFIKKFSAIHDDKHCCGGRVLSRQGQQALRAPSAGQTRRLFDRV